MNTFNHITIFDDLAGATNAVNAIANVVTPSLMVTETQALYCSSPEAKARHS